MVQFQFLLFIKPLQFLSIPDFLFGKATLLPKLLKCPHIFRNLDIVKMPKQCLETKHISQYLSMMEEVYLCVLDHCDHIKLKVLQCCVISSEDLVYDGEDVEWLMDDLPVIRAFEEDLVR